MYSSKTTLTESASFQLGILCPPTKIGITKRQRIINKSKKVLLFSLFFLLTFLCIPNHLLAEDPCDATLLSLINDCNGFDTTTVNVHGEDVASSHALNTSCATPNNNVAWVTFTMDATTDVIQWELLGDSVSYELYYTFSSCANLNFLECGDEFTGLKQISNPNPNTTVHFYLAISEDVGKNVPSVDLALEACSCNLVIAPNVSSPVCAGTPYTLSADTISGTTPYTYFWTDSLGLTTNSPNPVTGTGAGVGTYTYYLNILDSKGCSQDSFIVVDVLPAPSLTGRDTNICLGQTVDLSTLITQTAFGDSLEYGSTYGNYNLNDSLITPIAAGTYSYFLRDSIGMTGCLDTAVVNVIVTAQPNITGRDTAICAGQTIDLSTLITQIQAGDSLEVGTLFGNYPMTAIVMPNTGTTIYYLRDSIGTTGCVDTAQIKVTVNQPNIIGRDTAICIGESVDLSNLVSRFFAGDSLEYGTNLGNYSLVDSVVTPTTVGAISTYFIRDSIGTTGCVDTAIVNVFVNPIPNLLTQNKMICAGESVDLSMQINGTILEMLEYGTSLSYGGNAVVSPMISTTYFVRDSVDATSCKDTEQIIITVNPVDTTDLTDTICETESHTFFGINYTSTGIYTHTLSQTNGCDSIIRLSLRVHPIDTIAIPRTICINQTYAFNNQTLNTTGIYLDTLIASTGCDSILKLLLTVHPIDTTDIMAVICAGDTYPFDGQNLNTAGVYLDTLSQTNGCDRIIRLNLGINPIVTTNLNATICSNESYLFNNQMLTTQGTYTATLTQTNGCDSLVTLKLKVNPTKTTTLSEVICSGDTYNFNGQNLTTTGIYQNTLSTTTGCDSLIILQLNILDAAESIIRQEICQGSSFTFNGQSLTTSGIYRETITNSNNCSSIIELRLTVNPKPTLVVNNKTCTSSFTTYNVSITASGGSVTSSAGTVSNTASNSYSISNVPANTNFTITVTNTNTGCSTSQAIAAPMCSCPLVNTPKGNNKTICEGATTPPLFVSVNTGETADWYTTPTGGTAITSSLTYTPTVTAPGIYHYYVRARNNATNCGSSNRTQITLTILPKPIASTTSNSVLFCSGSTLTLSANGNSGDTYQWYKTSNPSSVISTNQNYIVNNATFNEAGNYFVVVTNNQGCVSANSPLVKVGVTTTQSFTINANDINQLSSCNGNDGTIRINGFILNSSYSITYTKNGSNQSIGSFVANSTIFSLANLGAGNYDDFIITNTTTGCSANTVIGGPFVINNLNPETPTFSNNPVINPTTCGANDGSITINNLTNGATYQVIYDYNGTNFTTPNLTAASTQLLLPNLGAGLYSNFSINNLSTGCQSTLTTSFTLSEPTPNSVAVANGSIMQPKNCDNCDGGFIFSGFTPNETYDVTYTINGVANAEIGLQATINGEIIFDQKCPGNYNNFIFKNITTQCSTLPYTTSIALNTPITLTPQIDLFNGLIHPTLCGQDNGGIRLSNLAANAIYSVVYTKNGIPATFGPIASTATGEIVITNLGAGVYDVFQSTNENTGCQSVIVTGNNFVLNDPTTESATILAANSIHPSTCGGTDGQIFIENLNPNISYSINYTKNNITQNSILLTSSSTGEISLINLEDGQYDDFNLINQVSQCSITPNLNAALTLSDPMMTAQPTVLSSLTVCEGENLNLSIINANTLPVGATYLWTGPNGFISTLMQPTLNQITGIQAGDYTLVTTVNGCASNVVKTNVQIGTVPVVTIDQSGGVCGENLSLNAQVSSTNTSATYTYQWTGPNGFTSNNPNILITNPDDSTHSGSYQLIVTNNTGCQTAANTVLVKIIDNITSKPLLVSNRTSFCAGETLVLTTNDFTGSNVQYNWTITNSQTVNQTTTVPTLTLTDLDEITETAVYTVQINVNGCISDISDGMAIRVYPKPATPTTLSNITVCEGAQLDLAGNTTGIGNYQWTGPAGFTSNQQNPTVTNSATSIIAGTYTLVMEANNCTSDAVQVQVVVQSKPNATAVSNNGPICSGGLLNLTVDNPINNTTYEWFNGNGQSVGFGSTLGLSNATSNLSGDYYVVATRNGCSFDPSTVSTVTPNTFTTVEVSVQEVLIADAGADAFICEDNYDLTANLPNNSNAFGEWTSLNNSSVLIFDTQEPQTPVSHLQSGINTFVWTLSNTGCAGLATDTVEIFYFTGPSLTPDNIQTVFNTPTTFNVLFNDQLQTTDYTLNIVNQPTNGSLTLHGDETMTYYPRSNFDGIDQFTYQVCATACAEICATTTVSIEVVAQTEFATPTVITPNSDGLNDYFIIEGLGHYPNSSITIFNRWGDEVYRNADYKNDWEGFYRTAMLPVGTYFYVAEVNNSNQTKLSGYVYIQRE